MLKIVSKMHRLECLGDSLEMLIEVTADSDTRMFEKDGGALLRRDHMSQFET
jgi:hypothetical protein